MFEHVGPKNYRTYLEVVRRCLKAGGRFLLHTIGSGRWSSNSTSIRGWRSTSSRTRWCRGSSRSSTCIDGLFWLEGWQRIGPNYDTTLMAWRANFEKAWPDLSKTRDERFYRMWRYYLSSVAAGFRSRNADVWQVLLSAT